MSQIMEELCAKSAAEATAEATYNKSVDVAVRLIQLGKETYEEIADLTGLPLAEVEALAGRESA